MAASFNEVRDALQSIPPDLCRDDWWKIAAALKSEFNEPGFELFDQWSQGGDSYKAADCRDTWKSTRAEGGITIGTLFGMAQEHGYQARKTAHTATKQRRQAPPSTQKKNAAQAYWDQAHDCTGHAYAERKGHDTAGLKKWCGNLLIPAYNASGTMTTVQEIDEDGGKKFLKGCKASGTWYEIPGNEVLVVAEGWATAKSIHLATGYTAIVVFGSSGFKRVPALLRKKHPEARMVLAPDADGSRVAIKYATEAARECNCEIIVPEVEDGSDFNDVHLAAGLEEVRRQFAENVTWPQWHDIDLLSAAEVTPETVEWLWPGKFPLGKLVLLGGLPSTGKTTIVHSIIAILTTGGKWPYSQHSATQGRAVILTAEDDPADTVVPRLMAAGADLHRVHIVNSPLLLAHDMAQLDGLMRQYPDIRLINFDPLSAYLGAQDSHRESDVRQILGPVAHLAARHRVCILGIAHLNKNEQQSAMARFMGSGGIIAASRSAYLTAEVDSHLMMLPVKNNLAPREEAAGLTYAIRSTTVAGGIKTSCVEWTGETDLWANEALAQEAAAIRAPRLLEAKEFLADFLADGPKLQVEIETAAREKGIKWRTVRRAKEELGYQTSKDAFAGKNAGWKWYSADQWSNYQEVLAKAAKPATKPPEQQSNGHLGQPEEKLQICQQQKFGHLGGKTGVSAPLKPAPHNALHEGGQAIQETPQDGRTENSEKPAETAKVAKCAVLGTPRFDDGFGAI